MAVTLPLDMEPWALAGFPGRPPRHVLAMTACRRAAVAGGVSRSASVADCATRLGLSSPA